MSLSPYLRHEIACNVSLSFSDLNSILTFSLFACCKILSLFLKTCLGFFFFAWECCPLFSLLSTSFLLNLRDVKYALLKVCHLCAQVLPFFILPLLSSHFSDSFLTGACPKSGKARANILSPQSLTNRHQKPSSLILLARPMTLKPNPVTPP